MAEEDNEGVGLPQKGLNMIIKDVLPDMRIANESRELLNQCCVEFIKHISREAQQISSKDQRKTIYHDHVQKALKNLGFPREYVDAANSVLGECKIAAERRLKRKNSRLDKCGIPEEQLWMMQQQLIEQARREDAEKQQAAAAHFGGGSAEGTNFHTAMAAFGGPAGPSSAAFGGFGTAASAMAGFAFPQFSPNPAAPTAYPFFVPPQQQLMAAATAPPIFTPMGGIGGFDPTVAAQLLMAQQGNAAIAASFTPSTSQQQGQQQKAGEAEEDYDV